MNDEEDGGCWSSDDEYPDQGAAHRSILPPGLLGLYFLGDNPERNEAGRFINFPKLPVAIEELAGDLRQEADCCTSDNSVAARLVNLRSGSAAIAQQEGIVDPMEITIDSLCSLCNGISKPQEVSDSFPHQPRCNSSESSSTSEDISISRKRSVSQWGNVHHVISAREMGLCRGGGFSMNQQRHVLCNRRLPSHPECVVDGLPSRAYIGQFSKDGSLFLAAFQDRRIRIYDVKHDWKLRNDIEARMLSWTITDTALSPDGRFLLYSSITPFVHLVNVGSCTDDVESSANVTDVHEALYFGSTQEVARFASLSEQQFGIWSLAWSGDGREIVAGTSDNQENICVYNVEERETVVTVQGHTDDVNAVAFLDDSANVFVSGSDDSLVKVWDRRALGPMRRAAGVLVGHTEGITHIDCKGDGRHLISNSKDQTIKLWDVRKAVSEEELKRWSPISGLPHFRWDYRWNPYPGQGYAITHPRDNSLMTYRGHCVLQTLIRAYFSPLHTTGQRYIYTGSQTGAMHVFDIVTADEVARLDYHGSVVRDCSWHPTDMAIASVSWDGRIVRWCPQAGCTDTTGKSLPEPDEDRYGL